LRRIAENDINFFARRERKHGRADWQVNEPISHAVPFSSARLIALS
jgi:hypothetical protein